jgi:hypothetical protein
MQRIAARQTLKASRPVAVSATQTADTELTLEKRLAERMRKDPFPLLALNINNLLMLLGEAFLPLSGS